LDQICDGWTWSNTDWRNVVLTPFIEVPWWTCLEPDTEEDFEVAGAVMERMILQGRGEAVYREES
jgi:hypothetical protein